MATLTSLPVDNIAAYIAGYVLSHEKDNLCESCQTSFVLPEPPASDLRYEFIRLKCYDTESSMVFPTVCFIEFIKSCDKVLNTNLPSIIHSDKISQKLSEIFFNTSDVCSDLVSHIECLHVVNQIQKPCIDVLRDCAGLFFRAKIHHIMKNFSEIHDSSEQAKTNKRNRKFLKLSHC